MESAHISVILGALKKGPSQPLPPLNWAGLLSPILKMNLGPDIEEKLVCLAINQSPSAPTAAMFVTSLMMSPLWDCLQVWNYCIPYERLFQNMTPVLNIRELIQQTQPTSDYYLTIICAENAPIETDHFIFRLRAVQKFQNF